MICAVAVALPSLVLLAKAMSVIRAVDEIRDWLTAANLGCIAALDQLELGDENG